MCFEKAMQKQHLEAMVEIANFILEKYPNEKNSLEESVLKNKSIFIGKGAQPREASNPKEDYRNLINILKHGKSRNYPKALNLLGIIHTMDVFKGSMKIASTPEKKASEYFTLASKLNFADGHFNLGGNRIKIDDFLLNK